MEQRAISAAIVMDTAELVRRRGHDSERLLEAAGISTDATEPTSHVEYAQLWLAIADTMDDEFFGLSARPMRRGSFKMLTYSVLHTRNLEHALHRAVRFLRILMETPFGEVRRANGRVEIRLSDPSPAPSAFAHRTYWIILMGLLCWLIGRRIPLFHVDFACEPPSNQDGYLFFFGAPVHFNQPESVLSFSASYLTLPVIREESALREFLRGAPANILVRYQHETGFSAAIRKILRTSEPAKWPSFDELASKLNVSPATLRRRLRGEGQTLAAIREEMLYVTAQQMLKGGRRSVAEIAHQLGYAEPSAFYRAFLKWSGMTPAAYRKINRGPS